MVKFLLICFITQTHTHDESSLLEISSDKLSNIINSEIKRNQIRIDGNLLIIPLKNDNNSLQLTSYISNSIRKTMEFSSVSTLDKQLKDQLTSSDNIPAALWSAEHFQDTIELFNLLNFRYLLFGRLEHPPIFANKEVQIKVSLCIYDKKDQRILTANTIHLPQYNSKEVLKLAHLIRAQALHTRVIFGVIIIFILPFALLILQKFNPNPNEMLAVLAITLLTIIDLFAVVLLIGFEFDNLLTGITFIASVSAAFCWNALSAAHIFKLRRKLNV
ncbi:MAG: hypothetical protein HY606_08395 [Planctomycetes bacterium]|nr:hypothetical protein [Planctomycetota bacterium]